MSAKAFFTWRVLAIRKACTPMLLANSETSLYGIGHVESQTNAWSLPPLY